MVAPSFGLGVRALFSCRISGMPNLETILKQHIGQKITVMLIRPDRNLLGGEVKEVGDDILLLVDDEGEYKNEYYIPFSAIMYFYKSEPETAGYTGIHTVGQ